MALRHVGRCELATSGPGRAVGPVCVFVCVCVCRTDLFDIVITLVRRRYSCVSKTAVYTVHSCKNDNNKCIEVTVDYMEK